MILRIVCKKAFPVEELRGEDVDICHGCEFWVLGYWVIGILGCWSVGSYRLGVILKTVSRT